MSSSPSLPVPFWQNYNITFAFQSEPEAEVMVPAPGADDICQQMEAGGIALCLDLDAVPPIVPRYSIQG